MEAPTKLDDLIAVTNRLIDLMGKEIEMLRSMRPQNIGTLQKDKVHLALAYERHMRELRDNPSLLAAAKPDLKAELKQITGRFQEVLNENESAIRAVKTVSEKLLTAIANAVTEQRGDTAAYSREGAIGGNGGGPTAPISLNEQL
jgi:sulfur transfer complex TusBCD TusB component (DsrH family)